MFIYEHSRSVACELMPLVYRENSSHEFSFGSSTLDNVTNSKAHSN